MTTPISFDRAVDFYDQTRGFPPEEVNNIAAFIAQSAELHSESVVLEVGVGTGRVALPLSQHTGTMLGIDLSAAMMQLARNKPEGKRLFLAQAKAEHIPIHTQSLDAVLLVHILHLVSDLDAVMSEIARVLRPDGKLIHCWNLDNSVFQEFHQLWNRSSHRTDYWAKSRNAPRHYGWQQIFEPKSYAYHVTKSPQQFVDEFKNRIWSSTWALSDEEMQQNLATMEKAVAARYQVPHQPLTLDTTFVVDVYSPPSAI